MFEMLNAGRWTLTLAQGDGQEGGGWMLARVDLQDGGEGKNVSL